jgi:hypothetical protein
MWLWLEYAVSQNWAGFHHFQTSFIYSRLWTKIYYKEPEKVDIICRQRICHNFLITVADRPVVNNTCTNNKFIKMKELITDEGKLLTKENMKIMYNVQFKPLEYNSLISAIPKKWKKTLINDHMDLHHVTTNLESEIQIDNYMKPIETVDSKDIQTTTFKNRAKDRPVRTNGKKVMNSMKTKMTGKTSISVPLN